MRARIFAAVVAVALAGVLAGPVGAVVAASLAVGWAGWELRAGYAAAPRPDVELPDARMEPVGSPRRLEQISGQLAIGMSDGRYFDRVVRPLLNRIATGLVTRPGGDTASDGVVFEASADPRRAPDLAELSAMVDRMEQW